MKAEIRPRFEVQKLEGTYRRKIAKYVPVVDSEGEKTTQRRLEFEERECDRGWMIYFPNGSSIHIATESEMKRMGYDRDPTYIEMNTGEEIEGDFGGAIRKDVERRTKNSNRANIRKVV